MPIISLLVLRLVPANPSKYIKVQGRMHYNPLYQIRRSAHVNAMVWHRKELEKLDHEYERFLLTKKLVRERQKAHEAGVDPLDLKYPKVP